MRWLKMAVAEPSVWLKSLIQALGWVTEVVGGYRGGGGGVKGEFYI